ncbi:DUF559 domain-containing protein [Nocardioides sp. GY 10127]|uniref:DUF559 domain-containing protein n=1 Tax=Nocardioides sp. GY 10127 TaxID=2569762 RepID=UPI0010A8013C|nr:DUF559 domain-containing protein [Nocardioides sp. GY 10127]TIC84318.1 DUF559 domain-containing protein [Nocardioides sp. GY 10127]
MSTEPSPPSYGPLPPVPLTPAAALTRAGGVATRAELVALCGRQRFERAVVDGDLVRLVRDRYVARELCLATSRAVELGGLVSHRSAALLHGWKVLTEPELPDVLLPKGRTPSEEQRGRVSLHRTDLRPGQAARWITTPERTLLDCLRLRPFGEALAVADSALRAGVRPGRLRLWAATLRGPWSAHARVVADHASPLAANPFESALRALCLQVPGLSVRPQVRIMDGDVRIGRVDLADVRLRMVLEADSFSWHGDRAALDRDAVRYNALVAAGWLPLRFSWESVVIRPEQALAQIAGAVARRTEELGVRHSAA